MLGYIISDKDEINVEENEIKSFDILRGSDLNIFVIENNKVLYKNDIINNASAYGHVQVLEWFKNSGYKFKYDEWAIYEASSNGNIQVLEWFKNSGYEFKYTKKAINFAASNGYIQVLEWFKNSGYEFKYDEGAINYAFLKGYDTVLEWFKNSGYKFKYTKSAFGIFNLCELIGDNMFEARLTKILKFFSYKINIKKVIKWTDKFIFIKTLKFKTHNKYLKGYQKN